MTTIEAPASRTAPAPPSPTRPGWHRLLFGGPEQPRWARPALWVLLLATAVAYLQGLSRNGWANEYYAAAAQAGTQSWKALLFGSLDSGNAITVDKPPASLWVMGLSGRLFGFDSWAMLLPEALMGVASVALVYAAVRRWNGPAAGLLAGSLLALTPVAALMFRFNNPDALLVLLMVVAAYCTVRATECGSGRWLALAGVAIGFGFLAKMLQAFLVLPAFGSVFLIAAPIGVRQRILRLLGACLAVVVSAGWFLALVALWPSASRPYIGGSTDNSLLQLALGYNGLGRVLGGDGNHSGGGAFGGDTGLTRIFGETMGTEISWLVPAALIGLTAGLWFTRRAPRTARTRASLILWGGWLLVTGVVFSYMQGTMHPYYTVALAPAIAAGTAVAIVESWRGRAHLASRAVLGVMLAATGIWNFVLLDRTPDWYPALRWIVLIGAIATAAVLIVGAHQLGRLTATVAAAALLSGIAGATAYTVDTLVTAHNGSIPTSGPRTDRGMGGFGAPGATGSPNSAAAPGSVDTGSSGGRQLSTGQGSSAATRGGRGVSDNAELRKLLEETDNRWAAAAVGSQSVSGLELSTGASIMAIGGFTGGDDSPTLAQFQSYVADGDVHYFIASGGGGFGRDSGTGARIAAWVQSNFRALTVGDATVYDLTQPVG
ncbi:ArnT family glycosyltransferase [Nocardia pseudobrasiliensis]|uniref:4-amino-4-deoxy-L-arabinose transferase-like glycosyltransferase n=1 Tax=Nocardia pseudobrasiliensis TaxID=45979 RepID=A0A370I0P2_9NOCA|nr:glycosyltransferase family 39 protein [Nocardia pseudobrasiliensis]RDI63751.1 4-amino-4-deoxy-L-arabinose transferase-like glycosyltransferase [Nocardia pseudobrasiliensis]